MSPERIFLPVALQRYVDAPPVAQRQRDLARLLAAACGAHITVASVEAPLALAPAAESVEQKLNAFVAPLISHGYDVTVRMLEGRPRDVIPAAVEDDKSDLVILGSHAKRGPLDVRMGSNAESLLSSLKCEVILVRPTAEDAARAKDMMIPDYPWVFTYV
jgi:nucleotide-binding universal stress UspA family protein